ncbi:phage Gp37/Gp68 family protein [Bacillus subtilis]|uniref:DUF5131 family protein n=1 Tax=Pseudochrobactrum asaccharolyticum TaxID=354351 RepID=UPI001F2D9B82|nr:phage Gp37/Gp68 family protein [Pseudochrobactrum asaccharolyticum]MCF7646862.1 phage Gp37/Gp68 family protein [Pseudochrobactrum asaccharolyticum]MCF7673504.1 phage Gp37/Gp68 family protein [Bacillus subtilis]
MAENSKIEWTDATWNPITGCSVVSPGCTNCYAMKLAGTRLQHHPSRAGLTNPTKSGPVWNGKVSLNRNWLAQPLEWKKPRMVFVCAHGDLFHDEVPDKWILDIYTIMAIAQQHTFQVLTKRADRMHDFLSRSDLLEEIYANWYTFSGNAREVWTWPLSNVWLGVSVEDQKRANERIPLLLDTPAAIRWISAEPLLGPLDLNSNMGGTQWIGGQRGCGGTHRHGGRSGEVIHGVMHVADPLTAHHHHDDRCAPGLDWVVTGGESGTAARAMQPDWARSLRDQCSAAKVPFFFKQWGNYAPLLSATTKDTMYRATKNIAGRLLDGREHNAMPEVRKS